MRNKTDVACGIYFALTGWSQDKTRSTKFLMTAFRYMDLKANVYSDSDKGFVATGKDKKQAEAFIEAVRNRLGPGEQFNQAIDEIERFLDEFKNGKDVKHPLWKSFCSLLNFFSKNKSSQQKIS